MKIGDKVYHVYASVQVKMITEFRIIKVNPKTIDVIGENDGERVRIKNFDNYQEGIMYDSFFQWAKTLQEADILAIQLMDVVANRKYVKMKDIQKEIDKSIETRNSAPEIRRMQ